MRDAKELFELALTSHRRMEKLTLIEKGAVISIVNALFQAEVQERQLMSASAQVTAAHAPPVDDEYQQ